MTPERPDQGTMNAAEDMLRENGYGHVWEYLAALEAEVNRLRGIEEVAEYLVRSIESGRTTSAEMGRGMLAPYRRMDDESGHREMVEAISNALAAGLISTNQAREMIARRVSTERARSLREDLQFGPSLLPPPGLVYCRPVPEPPPPDPAG